MPDHELSQAGSPRDRIRVALERLAGRRGVHLSEALQVLVDWSRESGMSIVDTADLVIAESRVRRDEHL